MCLGSNDKHVISLTARNFIINGFLRTGKISQNKTCPLLNTLICALYPTRYSSKYAYNHLPMNKILLTVTLYQLDGLSCNNRRSMNLPPPPPLPPLPLNGVLKQKQVDIRFRLTT